MAKHVIEEAKRCLGCKKPRCVEGCPVSTPIPQVIDMLLHGKIREAGEVLFNNNPLSIICAMVCPHEFQCEGHCILGNKGMPIHFSSIEHYISDYFLNLEAERQVTDPNKKVALIGSGPAGLTLAFILVQRGYDITIFEAYEKIGGILQFGIPDFRLPKPFLDRIQKKLLKMGVKIRPNTLIGPNLTIDDLKRDGYKAIFIGTGVWKPNKLNIPGESLGHVHFAIDYLKKPEAYNLGETLYVIGAGNVAMDVARTALRRGVQEAIVVNRLGEKEMTARPYEVEYARLDGVQFLFNTSPKKIVDDGLICCSNETSRDEEDRIVIKEIEGTETFYRADSVIVSISQGPRNNIVANTEGINTGVSGLVKVDSHGQTTLEGVFSSGDVVTGGKTVVEAVKYSKIVADSIDEYIQSKYFSNREEQ